MLCFTLKHVKCPKEIISLMRKNEPGAHYTMHMKCVKHQSHSAYKLIKTPDTKENSAC